VVEVAAVTPAILSLAPSEVKSSDLGLSGRSPTDLRLVFGDSLMAALTSSSFSSFVTSKRDLYCPIRSKCSQNQTSKTNTEAG